MKKLLKNTGITAVGLVIALLFEYIYQSILAKGLSIEQFGQFGAMYSLFFILSSLTSTGLVLHVTKCIKKKRQQNVFTNSLLLSLGINGCLLIVLLPTAFLWNSHLLFSMSVLLIVYPLLQVCKAIPYGQERFAVHALATGGEVVIKCALTFVLVKKYQDPSVGFLAFILANIVTLFLLYPTFSSLLSRPRWKREDLEDTLRHAVPMTGITLLTVAFIRIDTVLIKVLRGSIDAAYYHVATSFSRPVYYLLSTFAFTLFPTLVESPIKQVRTQVRAYWPHFLGVLIVGNIITPFVARFALELLFPLYTSVVPLIQMLVLAMSLFSIVHIVISIFMAHEKYKHIFSQLLLANLALVLLFFAVKNNPLQWFAYCSVLTCFALVITSLHAVFVKKKGT